MERYGDEAYCDGETARNACLRADREKTAHPPGEGGCAVVMSREADVQVKAYLDSVMYFVRVSDPAVRRYMYTPLDSTLASNCTV